MITDKEQLIALADTLPPAGQEELVNFLDWLQYKYDQKRLDALRVQLQVGLDDIQHERFSKFDEQAVETVKTNARERRKLP